VRHFDSRGVAQQPQRAPIYLARAAYNELDMALAYRVARLAMEPRSGPQMT
jgi:hypothetical protein